MISITGNSTNTQRGFTYVMALMATTVVAIGALTAYPYRVYETDRAREAELLFRGLAYYHAIESYYQARTPHEYPARLEDLLQDPRFMHKRHLRQLYPTPDGTPWGVVRTAQGRVMGVVYQSDHRPWQQVGFEKPLESFNGAKRYRDWRFVYPASISELIIK